MPPEPRGGPTGSAPVLSRLAIVADDLSGAADCAASFTGAVGAVRLHLDAEAIRRESCFALDCDTRWRDATAAATIFARAVASLVPGGLVYKKIDSTLRGHVGAELAAMLRQSAGIRTVIVAPAFPAQGRTLVAGRLHVHGEVARGSGESLGRTLARSLAGCEIVELSVETLAAGGLREALRIGDSRPRVLVADAIVDAHLAAIAREALAAPATPLFAGSAGLARAIAACPPRGPASGRSPGPALVVIGSFSNAARAQVEAFAAKAEGEIVAIPVEEGPTEHAAPRALHALERGSDVLVHFAFGPAPGIGSRARVRALARALLPAARACATLVLAGGDTARVMLEALGVKSLLVEGEAEPGIPVCAPFADRGPRVVLKAGGFGDNAVLLRLAGRRAPASTSRLDR